MLSVYRFFLFLSLKFKLRYLELSIKLKTESLKNLSPGYNTNRLGRRRYLILKYFMKIVRVFVNLNLIIEIINFLLTTVEETCFFSSSNYFLILFRSVLF